MMTVGEIPFKNLHTGECMFNSFTTVGPGRQATRIRTRSLTEVFRTCGQTAAPIGLLSLPLQPDRGPTVIEAGAPGPARPGPAVREIRRRESSIHHSRKKFLFINAIDLVSAVTAAVCRKDRNEVGSTLRGLIAASSDTARNSVILISPTFLLEQPLTRRRGLFYECIQTPDAATTGRKACTG